MESIVLGLNRPVATFSRAYVVCVTRGNCTLSVRPEQTAQPPRAVTPALPARVAPARAARSSPPRVVRGPCILVVPPLRSQHVDLQGRWQTWEVPEPLWQDAVRTLQSQGVDLGQSVGSVEITEADSDFLATFHANLHAQFASQGSECLSLQGLLFVLAFFNTRLHHALTDKPLWTIEDVHTYVQEHYTDTHYLDFYAAKCAMNISSFSQAFKLHAGVPLFEFINRVRIGHACRLLKQGHRNVIDISTELGYNNLSFFNRYFRKVVGCSPSEYRKR